MTDLIEKTYFKLSNGGAYLGPKKIHDVLERENVKPPSIHKIRKWLASKDSYTLLRQPRRRFRRARVVVSEPMEQFQIDLADMSSLMEYNDGYRYVLVTIDIFSRFLWLRALKTKTAKEVKTTLA